MINVNNITFKINEIFKIKEYVLFSINCTLFSLNCDFFSIIKMTKENILIKI